MNDSHQCSNSHQQVAAAYEAEAAVREVLVGDTGLARQQAQTVPALWNGREVEGIPALALELARDSAQATRLADGLELAAYLRKGNDSMQGLDNFPVDSMLRLPTRSHVVIQLSRFISGFSALGSDGGV